MATPAQNTPILIGFTLDFETGGLNCQACGCTQIAIHATRLDTFERVGTFVRYISPYRKKEIKGVGTPKRKVLKSKYDTEEAPMMEYQEIALTYSAITMDMLEKQGQSIEEVAKDALQFIIDHTPVKCPKNLKPFLIGQNIDFDKGFFMQLMEYGGLTKEVKKYLRGKDDFYGHWQPETLDTIMLAQLALCHLPDVTTYKLESICERLGVELDDAHDADADVAATTNVAAVLTQRMRNPGGEAEESLAISKTEKTRKHFKI